MKIEPCLAGAVSGDEDQDLCKWYKTCARSVVIPKDRQPGDPIIICGWYHKVVNDRCTNFIPKMEIV